MAKKKAKNAANQAALDRLYELKEKSANTKYVHTVSRAITSLATCPNAVTTRKAAVELKYVGPHMAKLIVPQEAAPTRTVSRGSSVEENDSPSIPKRKRKLPTVPAPSRVGAAEKVSSLSAKQVAYDKAVEHANALQLPSGPWKVILLLDARERPADHVQAKLLMSGIPCEQRHLPIGDMAWLAQCGDTEIMLGSIVERKQVGDLASSLFGTRYNEQRLRLQHCGLPQLLLLVEGDTNTVHNCPGDTLETCMMETRVNLNFQIVQTKHLDDTVRFLKNVHRRILQRAFPSAFGADLPTALPSFSSPQRKRRRRNNQKLSLIDLIFDEPPVPPLGMARFVTYTQLKAKVERDREAGTRTVGAIHAAMLKQVPSLSLKKVQAIQQAYPTPKALFETFVGLSEQDGKTLCQDFLSNTGMERTCRVGPKSAAEVYHAYTQVLEEEEEEATGEGVARIPSPEASLLGNNKNDKAFSPVLQGYSSSPEWSSQSDTKPAAVDTTTLTSPPFPTVDNEMQLAIQRRRLQYQESQKKPAAAVDKTNTMNDDLVDLTQGCESDTENTNNNNVGFSQQSTDDVGFLSSQASSSSRNSPPVCANAAAAAAAAAAAFQESNTSLCDDEEEEPLYVRLQRLHQARHAVESRKRQSPPQNDERNNNKTSVKQADVIEIE